MRILAQPRLLLRQRLTPSVRQPQQLRPISVLSAVHILGRRSVDRGLKNELDRALSIKNQGQKQQILFDVLRRFAANNGGSDLRRAGVHEPQRRCVAQKACKRRQGPAA
ncbi:hypothetical protein DHEL01_v201205 [Diaporthe helianthi]|uniref:Uncharacterized protein n=1 Tax=Diaporthe helianthi TaxID=158607 RepID=A0A2P5ID31_DIAHE|nr:hypothetical protein DHEL01_v201205 [Diaporthe helianthi]